MNKGIMVASIALITLCGPSSAETVTTTDGRRIELNPDGTFTLLESSETKVSLEVADHYLMKHEGQFGQRAIRFMPIFGNTSDREIVGIKFSSQFLSAFGEVVFSFSGESSERIPPGAVSTSNTYFFFEDNQFIANEPYDKLLIFIANSTGRIETKVEAIAFADGEVVTIE